MAIDPIFQSLISAGSGILGALIGGLTTFRVTETNQKNALAIERRRAKLSKGEELVAVLSELSSWRAREDQALLTEIAQLEAKLNRAFALTLTYFGNDDNVAGTFYSQGQAVMEKLNEIADTYYGSSPAADPASINHEYLVFQAASRNLTSWIIDEMRRTP
jgi:hypothetical protein